MSSNNRTTSKGGKGLRGEKGHKMDKSESKGSGDKQHSATSGGGDTKSNEHKINQIMEMTQRSENQVCLALHECDYDMERAIHMLLDLPAEDEWETTVKKRKNRQQSASKAEQKADNAVTTTAADDPWNDPTTNSAPGDKDKPRNKTSGSQRFHGRHSDSRGWRGREKQENERNLEDGNVSGRERRGRSGGSTRGGGGSRGRGGGRAGGRYPARSSRGGGGGSGGTFNNRPMETWDNSWDASTAATNTTNHTTGEENWGDEFPGADEWCGTLTETKVFTPSQPTEPSVEQESKTGGTMDNTAATLGTVQQSMEMLAQISGQNPPVAMSGTLNAAQTQYFSQLTQQSNNNELNKYSVQGAAVAQANYGNNNPQYSATQQQANTYSNSSYNNYASSQEVPVHQQQPPTRTKVQRAKLPPPSKIPSTAVEMPGDLNTNMGLLDLQFGAMDIMSDSSSFDGVSGDPKYQNASSMLDTNIPPSIDLSNQAQVTAATLDAYSPSKPQAQSSISSALTQSLSNSDSIPQTSEHLTSGGGGGYNATSAVSQRSLTAVSTNAQANNNNTLEQLSKQQSDSSHSYSQASSYNSYQPKSANYPNQTYSSSANYSSTQTTNAYVPNQGSNSSYVNSDASSGYNNNANNSYQNTYSTNTYQASTTNNPPFPSISQGNTYASANQSYPQNASQSVYGANSGLNNTSTYGSNTSSATQYNNYNSNHKLVKDTSSGYDSGTTVTSSMSTTSTVTSTPLTLTSTVASSKTNTTLSKNSNSVVSNIPPSATPVMGQYIMGQVPYFQPPMYSYEEMQMLQQRIPHMTTPFYEMSYQTPATTLRDGSYSLSDGRFTRTDSNASPVSSTQTSTQPMLAAQTTGPYFFTPYNPMQPSYQFGAVYTSQLPAGTNAHGSSTTAQYPKPATYGSGYTSGYDTLNQSQDYSKGGYVSNTQGQNKGAAANATSGANAANDLSAMYGKSHTALGKVNSYEKQGFHSGTPPPFTGALGQNALAPSGTGYGPQMYIPTLPHQQHHSTPMMHQPLHQMEVRHHGRRMDSGNSTGQRAQGNNQQKTGSKQAYPTSYWNQS